jgi:hypothetical protein
MIAISEMPKERFAVRFASLSELVSKLFVRVPQLFSAANKKTSGAFQLIAISFIEYPP